MSAKTFFITGTDTGVGKTLLTALLLTYLRARGCHALALKPFCSGGRADAELLHRLQNGDLTLDEINPFYFPEPVAPLISARKHKRNIQVGQVVQHINSIAARHSPSSVSPHHRSTKNSKLKTQNYLLLEGSGGLLVPLGEGYTVRDLIARLRGEVLVVARNQLGTINHTLLTVQALLSPPRDSSLRTPHSALKVVLMQPSSPDHSSRTNPLILTELLAPIPVLELPFLGRNCTSVSALKRAAGQYHEILARLV